MSSSTPQNNANDYLYSTDSTPLGIDFREWPIHYFNDYLDRFHDDALNFKDECHFGTKDSVIFLPSLFTVHKPEYECDFTTDNSFFFPVFMEECDDSTPFLNSNLEGCVKENNNYASGTVSINGQNITNLNVYRIITNVFTIRYKPFNPYNATPGIDYQALIDGLFVFIKPLQEDRYEIEYTVNQETPTLNDRYKSGIKYILNINSS